MARAVCSCAPPSGAEHFIRQYRLGVLVCVWGGYLIVSALFVRRLPWAPGPMKMPA